MGLSKKVHVKHSMHVANSLPLEECNVEKGGVKVNELKEIHLGNETVIIFSLGAMEFCNKSIITEL